MADFMVTSGDDIILVSAFGVGWATPSLTEFLPEDQRPCVSLGVIGVKAFTFEPVTVGVATPWIGIAGLQGQCEAMRDALPEELRGRWRADQAAARAQTANGLRDARFGGWW